MDITSYNIHGVCHGTMEKSITWRNPYTMIIAMVCGIYHIYYLVGGLASGSNKHKSPRRAHLKSLQPKMRTTTLLILPLLVASIYAESKLPYTKYLYKIQILVQR